MNNLVFFNSLIDVFSAFIVFIAGGIFIVSLSRIFNASKIRVLGLYLWHTVFALAYAYVTTLMVADSISYYFVSLATLPDFKIGTVAVYYFTALFTQGFGLSYIGTFLVYNIFGAIGLVSVDAALRHATHDKPSSIKLFALITVLLPSMSFWTGAIGKDSIAFMATGLALWSALNFRNRYVMMMLAVFAMVMVRPHIGGVMVLALAIAFILTGGLTVLQRFILSFLTLLAVVVVVPVMFNYIGLGDQVSAELIQENIERRQGFNQQGGGGVDITTMTLPEQIFSYLFRPLPYEAHSVFALISSLDNLFLLFLFVLVIFTLRRGLSVNGFLFHPTENRWFLFIFAITTLLVLSVTTSNLGIAVRQKWMFMPILLYFVFLYLYIDIRFTKKSRL